MKHAHTLSMATILMALHSTGHAGRPLAVEDAGVTPKGQCQVEAWLESSRAPETSQVATLAPACGVADGLEVGVELGMPSRTSQGDQRRGLALKWAPEAAQWAGWQMGGGLLGIIGCVIVVSSDKWERHGALMAGLGNLALAALFLVFAALSRDVEKGLLLYSLSKFPGLMVSGGCAVIAFRFVIWGEE